eukprot:GGOE01047108.1.p1 GENE.GGOE01047108.1~~GGOE01047108.1.p1  ORF type:complete len:130 (-),score=6.48 GGOE01047108.1:8-397(-)
MTSVNVSMDGAPAGGLTMDGIPPQSTPPAPHNNAIVDVPLHLSSWYSATRPAGGPQPCSSAWMSQRALTDRPTMPPHCHAIPLPLCDAYALLAFAFAKRVLCRPFIVPSPTLVCCSHTFPLHSVSCVAR